MIRANLGRHAKIIATLGPASSSVEMIASLILAGMNVARINMSHGTHESHAALIKNIREASRETGLEVAILIDLQGPKIRIDKLPAPLQLQEGETWMIGTTSVRDAHPEYQGRFIPTTYERLVSDCRDGDRILFNDGAITTRAVARRNNIYEIKVEVGGQLTSHKGINLPDSIVTTSSFTEKDRLDLAFGLKHQIDYVALSFVRKKEDVFQLKKAINEHREDLPVVAKIENPEGIKNIQEIIDTADVIMVARGDMGVEIGNHLVPTIQKQIISRCNNQGVPVITATQMLESMIESPVPTRAEASDVANAIWDGTDAVMLSAETASGKYPLAAITMMGKIIHEAEKTPKERPSLRNLDLARVDDAIMLAASLLAEKIGAKRILAVSESGNSCRRITQYRPKVSILGISHHLHVVRKMCLYWGVSPFLLRDYQEDRPDLEAYVINEVKERCQLHDGDKIVITRGSGKFFASGSANSVRVETINQQP
ncbi:MAG: pyruvate kinase [Xanthomonadaceae bacterium]|nr:pyruvate kinase [Xanthomonadaceae bacterium]